MDKNKKQLHDLARQIHNLKKFFFKKKMFNLFCCIIYQIQLRSKYISINNNDLI